MQMEVNHFKMPDGEIVNLEDWNLVADITTEEEATALEVTQKQGGGSFELEEFVLVIKSAGSSTNESVQNKNAIFNISGYNVGFFSSILYNNGVTRTWVVKGNVSPILFLTGAEYNTDANYNSGRPFNGFGGYDYSGRFGKVTSAKVTMQAGVFGAGSRMILYGR